MKRLTKTELPAKLRKRLKRQLADINNPDRFVVAQPFGGTRHGSKRFLSVYNADTDTYRMWRVDGNEDPSSITLFKRRWLAKLVRDELARRRPKIDKSMRVVKVQVDEWNCLIPETLKLSTRAKTRRK